MEAVFICAHNPALNVLQVRIADNLDALGKSLRANGALVKACSLKLFIGKQGKAIYHTLALISFNRDLPGMKRAKQPPRRPCPPWP